MTVGWPLPLTCGSISFKYKPPCPHSLCGSQFPTSMSFPGLVKSWIWISALASLAGWLLSAAGRLNRLGYIIFGLVLLAVWFVYRQRAAVRPTLPRKKVVNWPKFRRRFGRPFPLGFAVLALLVLI